MYIFFPIIYIQTRVFSIPSYLRKNVIDKILGEDTFIIHSSIPEIHEDYKTRLTDLNYYQGNNLFIFFLKIFSFSFYFWCIHTARCLRLKTHFEVAQLFYNQGMFVHPMEIMVIFCDLLLPSYILAAMPLASRSSMYS